VTTGNAIATEAAPWRDERADQPRPEQSWSPEASVDLPAPEHLGILQVQVMARDNMTSRKNRNVSSASEEAYTEIVCVRIWHLDRKIAPRYVLATQNTIELR